MKKIIVTIVILVGVIFLGIKGKTLLETRKVELEKTALPVVEAMRVSVVKAKEGSLTNTSSFLAQVRWEKSIHLSTKLAGYIENVYVKESQHVKKGALLVTIDASELHSSIASLKSTLSTQKSDLALAKSIHSRNVKLYNVGGIARERMEISAFTVEAKRSIIKNTQQKIAQLKHELSYLSIKAPFSGVIDRILLHEGDLASTAKPILFMSDGRKKLVFSYATKELNSLQKGMSVWKNGEKIGVIDALYTTASNGLLSAEVGLSKELSLPVESSLTIDVLTQASKGCILPTNTLVHKKEGVFVMQYLQGKFEPLKVNIEMQEKQEVMLSPCPTHPVAYGNEVKLAELPIYKKLKILGETNAN